jgi:hypothetical protein
MSLPPTPPSYQSWNEYIEEQGAIVAAAQNLTFQEGKATVKLLQVATPGRTDPNSPDYMIYNIFTTWTARAVSPTIGRPWREGPTPSPTTGPALVTNTGFAFVTNLGQPIVTQIPT